MSGRYQGLTLVRIPAQLELTLSLSAQLKLTMSSIQPKSTRGCVPRVLKLSSNVSDVFPKVLKLSSEVSECTLVPRGRHPLAGVGAQRRGHAVRAAHQRGDGHAGQPSEETQGVGAAARAGPGGVHGRGLHSLPFQRNLSSSDYRTTQLDPCMCPECPQVELLRERV